MCTMTAIDGPETPARGLDRHTILPMIALVRDTVNRDRLNPRLFRNGLVAVGAGIRH